MIQDEINKPINDLKDKMSELATTSLGDVTGKVSDLTSKVTDVKAMGEAAKNKAKSLRDKLVSLGQGALLTVVIGGVLSLFLPWWIIAVVAAAVAYWVGDSSGRSFMAAFVGVSLLYSVYAGVMDYQNLNLLSGRISQVFKGFVTGTQLVYVTGLLGGLVAGLGALTGSSLRSALR